MYKLDESYANYAKVGAKLLAQVQITGIQHLQLIKGSDDGIAVNMNVIADMADL